MWMYIPSDCTGRTDRFNRYMVECEYASADGFMSIPEGFNRYMVECECRLWWSGFTRRTGFNRYMVECEWGMNNIALSAHVF